MSAYTEDADKAIMAAQRTVEPGDLVTHEDDIGGILGRVFTVVDDTVQVIWSQTGRCVSVAADRIHFLERPEAYVSVEYSPDESNGEENSYRFVAVGTAEEVRQDMAVYGRSAQHTVVCSRTDSDAETD